MKGKLLIVAFLFWIFCLNVYAKDYYFPNVTVTIYIQDDGSFNVIEKRTYNFSGEFHWATYTLEKQGFERIENFTISDENGQYVQTQFETDAPGTFIFQDQVYSYYSKFFYNAYNTRKTFTISYKVIGGIKVYEDVADFYWKLIGSGWDKKTSFFEAFVYLPSKVDEKDLKVFGHGPLNGTVERIDGNCAHYIARDVPPNTFIEARVIFPSSILPKANVIPENKLNEIMQEESSAGILTNIRNLVISPFGSVLLLVIFFVIYIFLYIKFGKEPKPSKEVIYTREPPQDLPPAIVGYLIRTKEVLPIDLTATILYLVKKGYITLEMKEEEKDNLIFKKKEQVIYFHKTNKDPSQLSEYNHLKFTYHLLFDIIAEGKDFVSTEMIKSFSQKNRGVAYQSFNDFIEEVKADANKLKYFEDRKKIITFYYLLSLTFSFMSLLPFAISGFLKIDLFIFLSLFLGSALYAILSPSLEKRTQLGADAYAEWMGLKKFLEDFSNLEEYPPTSITIWEDYLVYATTFGIAEKVLQYLQINLDKISSKEIGNSHIYIFFGLTTTTGKLDTTSFNAFATSLNNAFTTMTSSPGGVGGGGGFSGGGGGGGGGSGGGAG